jgi:hypothetical protein
MEWNLLMAAILATSPVPVNPVDPGEPLPPLIGCLDHVDVPPPDYAPPAKKTLWQRVGPHGDHPVLHWVAAKAHTAWERIHPARYSADPNRRMLLKLNTAEDLREIEDEWSRFWFSDQPAHLTYDASADPWSKRRTTLLWSLFVMGCHGLFHQPAICINCPREIPA